MKKMLKIEKVDIKNTVDTYHIEDDWFAEIITTETDYEFWIYRENYTIKLFYASREKDDISYDDFVEIYGHLIRKLRDGFEEYDEIDKFTEKMEDEKYDIDKDEEDDDDPERIDKFEIDGYALTIEEIYDMLETDRYLKAGEYARDTAILEIKEYLMKNFPGKYFDKNAIAYKLEDGDEDIAYDYASEHGLKFDKHGSLLKHLITD